MIESLFLYSIRKNNHRPERKNNHRAERKNNHRPERKNNYMTEILAIQYLILII